MPLEQQKMEGADECTAAALGDRVADSPSHRSKATASPVRAIETHKNAEADSFIRNAHNFACGLRRMYEHNEALIFWNAARDMKLMLRADVGEGDDMHMAFDLVILYDEESDRSRVFSEMLDLEHDGYFDDDEDVFVVDTFRMIKCPQVDDEDLQEAMCVINRLHATKICACSRYMIKNGETSCTFCLLTADAADAMEFSCPICFEKSFVCHAVTQPCCSNLLHRSCLNKWSNESIDSARHCPICRAP